LNNVGGKDNNDIGVLMLTKVEGNGLIGATGYYHILAIPHYPMNELLRPDSFRF
jgi:hypothetical protein